MSLFIRRTINFILSLNPNIEKWLDTGCGTGTLVKKSQSIFPNTKFYLTYPSSGMLEQAKNKLEKLSNITILNPIETKELPIEYNNSFDIITAIQAHHYMNREGRKKSTERCYDLLKKDGIFITFENTRPLTVDGIENNKNYWKQFQLKEGKEKMDVEKHISRFDKEYFPITVEEHLNMLREMRFKVVELFWYSYMQSGYYCIK